MENFGAVNGTAGNSAPVGGRRRKLQLVTKKQARKMLKKLGKKLRGGGADAPVAVDKALADSAAAPAGGKRTRRRRHSSVSKGMFGL
jgi:hypothetical protein